MNRLTRRDAAKLVVGAVVGAIAVLGASAVLFRKNGMADIKDPKDDAPPPPGGEHEHPGLMKFDEKAWEEHDRVMRKEREASAGRPLEPNVPKHEPGPKPPDVPGTGGQG